MEQSESKFNITETIRTIRKAREELQKAVNAERNAREPLLTDITLMGELLGMFREQIGGRELTVDDRRMFIFIVQYLFAPHNLFGSKMPKGLRRAIATTLQINAESVVSDVGRVTLLNYQVYTQFRMEVNRIFDGISSWIAEKRENKNQKPEP